MPIGLNSDKSTYVIGERSSLQQDRRQRVLLLSSVQVAQTLSPNLGEELHGLIRGQTELARGFLPYPNTLLSHQALDT